MVIFISEPFCLLTVTIAFAVVLSAFPGSLDFRVPLKDPVATSMDGPESSSLLHEDSAVVLTASHAKTASLIVDFIGFYYSCVSIHGRNYLATSKHHLHEEISKEDV